MRYENVKLQMRLNQGPNDDVDGHEMNKIRFSTIRKVNTPGEGKL